MRRREYLYGNQKNIIPWSDSAQRVQSDAEVFITARFGFNASKLVIIPDVETYESNRYGNVRLAKAEIRKPLHVSESFNYARFDVLCKGGHMQWELVDGKLCDYESPNI